jgi:hypothetical protein
MRVLCLAILLVAPTADAQTLLVNDSLRGSTLGERRGGSFAADGWHVTGADNYIVWHVPTLTAGAVEFSVSGLRPREDRAENADKGELFHMYDWTFEDADHNYGGYRNNPYKHFIRKTGVLDDRPGRTDALEMLLAITGNVEEPDTQVLSWDPAVTYRFREQWGPDGGNTTIDTWRDGVRIMRMSQPGLWNPAGHSVRIGVARLMEGSGAPLDAVFSDVMIWDLEEEPLPPGAGLNATYFHDAAFSQPAFSRTDTKIDFDWGDDGPEGTDADTFSIRWSGSVQPRFSETYTFTTASDDGIRVWVDGALVVDHWWDHGVEERSGTIGLEADRWYDLTIEYYENTGFAAAHLYWSSPSQGRQIIPGARLQAPTNYDAAFVSQLIPTSLSAGATGHVQIIMRNTGGAAWTVADEVRLGSQAPQDTFRWGDSRAELSGPVQPGAEATITFDITAPTIPGVYDFQWQMLKENVAWFGEATPLSQITVNATPIEGGDTDGPPAGGGDYDRYIGGGDYDAAPGQYQVDAQPSGGCHATGVGLWLVLGVLATRALRRPSRRP